MKVLVNTGTFVFLYFLIPPLHVGKYKHKNIRKFSLLLLDAITGMTFLYLELEHMIMLSNKWELQNCIVKWSFIKLSACYNNFHCVGKLIDIRCEIEKTRNQWLNAIMIYSMVSCFYQRQTSPCITCNIKERKGGMGQKLFHEWTGNGDC